jgi:hypothetical protein
MLRLGRKYDIRRAKDDAIARIHHQFPADFEDFTNMKYSWSQIAVHPGILADLLNLAYECGIYTSIPYLGFCCLYAHKLVSIPV